MEKMIKKSILAQSILAQSILAQKNILAVEMIAIGRLLLALLSVVFLMQCAEYRHLFYPLKGPDPCDPTYSVYQGNIHFMESSFLDEDGRIDYKKLREALRPEASLCDPLKPIKAAEVVPAGQ